MAMLREILPHDAELINGTWDVGVTGHDNSTYRVDPGARWDARAGAYVELEQDAYTAYSVTDVETYLNQQGIPLKGWRKFHPDDLEEWTCGCDPKVETPGAPVQGDTGRIPNLSTERKVQRFGTIIRLAAERGDSQEEVARWLDSDDASAIRARSRIEDTAQREWKRKRRIE